MCELHAQRKVPLYVLYPEKLNIYSTYSIVDRKPKVSGLKAPGGFGDIFWEINKSERYRVIESPPKSDKREMLRLIDYYIHEILYITDNNRNNIITALISISKLFEGM